MVHFRSMSVILGELIKEYNKKEAVTICKINADEDKAIKVLPRRSELVIREVKLAWARERVPHSAIPMSLLGAAFLDESKELPVKAAENPRWYGILKPTEVAYSPLMLCWRALCGAACSTGTLLRSDWNSTPGEVRCVFPALHRQVHAQDPGDHRQGEAAQRPELCVPVPGR